MAWTYGKNSGYTIYEGDCPVPENTYTRYVPQGEYQQLKILLGAYMEQAGNQNLDILWECTRQSLDFQRGEWGVEFNSKPAKKSSFGYKHFLKLSQTIHTYTSTRCTFAINTDQIIAFIALS